MKEEEEELDTSVLDKRNFLLLLSPGNADIINKIGGFSSPSKDVRDQEIIDVITTWLTLAGFGVLRHIDICAEWVTEFALINEDSSKDFHRKVKAGYYSFAVSLISHLIGIGAIHLHQLGVTDENLLEFAENKPSSFNLSILNTFLGDDEDDE